MNLKKRLLSGLAMTALVTTLLAPSAYAVDEQTTSATAKDVGKVTAELDRDPIYFNVGEVTTFDSSATLTYLGMDVGFSDTHSYNPAVWTLSITATDLKTDDGVYSIGSENLRMTQRYNNDTCITLPEVGENEYQTYNAFPYAGQSLTGGQTVVEGTTGRGCGPSKVGVTLSLTIPAGTYTGVDGNATYTGKITLSNTAEVTDEDNK